MNRGLLFPGLAFLLYLSCLTAIAQQPEMAWVQHYDGTGSTDDNPVSMAVDAEGNSYVTGTSSNENKGQYSMVTVKYSPTGEELWASVYRGEFSSASRAIAIDSRGGVYVTGVSFGKNFNDFSSFTIRYESASGAQSWISHYDGGGNELNDARAIAVDDKGGVYVTGSSEVGGDSRDYATIRHDASSGAQSWVSRYDAGNELPGGYSDDFAQAIAVDNRGGVYITGYSRGLATFNDFATVRYEADTGKETWASRYDGGFSEDQAWAIAVDSSGGVYITGYAQVENSIDDLDFATVRYEAATGAQSWVSRYDSGGHKYDEARAIAVDNAGGVYISGLSYGDTGTGFDFATLRYDTFTGDQSWVSRYEHGFSGDASTAIAVDGAGGVYVTGGIFSPATGGFFSTFKYNAADGAKIWEVQTDGPDDAPVGIGLDMAGNVIVTGSSKQVTTGYDFLTVKYRQQGECPNLAGVAISGNPTAAVGTSGSIYSLPASESSFFAWAITDPDGKAYTDFTGQGIGSISVDWPYEPNVYKVSVTYSAGEGCPSQTSVRYVRVFDSAAGFVSGGGWSDSPANSDYELMQKSGKAYWGFIARYRNGNQVQGASLILLEAGPAAFRSTSVEDGSLVVAGNRASFRGMGALTLKEGSDLRIDARRFGYLVSAIDGHLGPVRGEDKLRLRIWVINEDGSEGKAVYDNQITCSSASLDDNAPACGEIAKGNVIIHRRDIRGLASLFSLADAEDPQGLQAYPTAFSDRATIRFATANDAAYNLELYDGKGALIRQLASGVAEKDRRYEYVLQAEGLASGLYLARLTTATKVQTVKLIVQQ